MKRTSSLLTVLVLMATAAGGVHAETKLDISIRPLGGMPRADAPMLLKADFVLGGAELLDGTLHMTLESHQGTTYSLNGVPVALTRGRQSRVLLVPPAVSSRVGGQTRLKGYLRTNRGTFRFNIFPFTADPGERRSFLIGECSPGRFTGVETAVRDSLRLEQLDPLGVRNNTKAVAVTGRVLVRPPEMFSDPLHYCSFDIMLVTARGLERLRDAQRAALGTWVRGGGSLGVLALSAAGQSTVDYLNRLDPDGEYALDEGRRLAWPGDSPVHRAQPGVGRLAVWRRPVRVDSPQNRGTVAFLWKFRDSHVEHIRRTGSWSEDVLNRNSVDRYGYQLSVRAVLAGREPHSMSQLREELMPRTVRLMPFSVVVLILVVFIVAVGPGDYVLLGLLRRRRWTWLLLPVVSIAVTWVTVRLAEGYMGADTRKSVTIVDVDKEGRVVRCNRLELIYASNEGTVETPLEQPGFFTRMPQYETSQSDTYGYPAQYGQVGPSDDRRPPVYRGQYPYDYRMAQEVRQWTPVVNRRFSFAPPADLDLLEVDWQAVEREALAYENRGEGGDTLLDTLGDDLPEGVEAHVLQWGTVPNWLEGLCRVESEGIHKLVSAVSPSGCWSYEDVPIPAQSSQTLVVVVEPREESYVVYRRLYGGEK